MYAGRWRCRWSQPELPRDGFALGYRLVTRICLTRSPDETGSVHGPDIELAWIVRRIDIKVAPIALPVLHSLVMAAHAGYGTARAIGRPPGLRTAKKE